MSFLQGEARLPQQLQRQRGSERGARGGGGERITRGEAGCVRGARVESGAGGEEEAAPARPPATAAAA